VRLRRIGMVLLVAGLAVGVGAPPASAHALLKRSVPADGSSVSRAPRALLLFFTEPPDPSLSIVSVLDATGKPVHGIGPPQPVPGDPNGLRVSVAPGTLPDGVYTVAWRTVSKTDGHVTAKAFSFGVGVPSSSVGPPRGGPSAPTTPSPTALAVAARWLFYWGLALLLGGAVAGPLLFGSSLPSGGRRLLGGAWAAAGAGVILMTVAERSTVGLPLGTLLSSTTGHQLMQQGVGVAVCGAAVAWVLARPARPSLVAMAATVAATLFHHAQAGHADTESSVRILNLADQWVHLLAVGIWVGGLAWLLLGLREGDRRAERARRFSALAVVAVAVIAVTGILRAIPEVGGFGNLIHTSFGLTLLAKAAVFLIVLGLAARNRQRLVPAMQGEQSARSLRRSVGGELALVAVILALTGILSELPPAAYVSAAARPAAPQQIVATGSDFATTVRVRLIVAPGTVGQNALTARVTDFDSGAPVDAQSVELQFSLPSDPTVSSTVDLRRAAAGTWTGRGTNLSINGLWNVQVVVQGESTSTDVALRLRTRLPAEHITTVTASGQPTIYTIDLSGGRSLQTYVDPGTPGPNTIHYTFFDASGNEQPISKATASAETPSGGLAGTKLIRFSQGHFAANATLAAGRWTFFIDATANDGTHLNAYFEQSIGQ
jgi:copper transport protein